MILYLDIMLTSKVFPHGTGPVCVIVIVTLEQVGEEKQFEYQKKNSQFGKNEQPQGASHGHSAEPVDVKPPHLICIILDIHCVTNNSRSVKLNHGRCVMLQIYNFYFRFSTV